MASCSLYIHILLLVSKLRLKDSKGLFPYGCSSVWHVFLTLHSCKAAQGKSLIPVKVLTQNIYVPTILVHITSLLHFAYLNKEEIQELLLFNKYGKK